jgi:hypothetical protein
MSRFAIERLEGRTLFASYTAASVADLIANINAANQSSQADTITLVAGKTFSLTAAAVDTESIGPSGMPTIMAGGGGLTILGNGDTIERSGAAGTPGFRLFEVGAGGSLTLKNLTLQGGFSTGAHTFAGQPPAQGGAIYSQGALNLESVTVQNNTAQGRSGFLAWGGLAQGADGQGGGLYSAGSLSLTDCTIRNNRAIGGQGLDKAWYTITGSGGTGTFVTVYTGTVGGNAAGGGIYVASGTAAILTTTMTANSAIAGTGGNGKGTSSADGVYIGSTASVGIDTFSKKLLKRTDIFGKYQSIQ